MLVLQPLSLRLSTPSPLKKQIRGKENKIIGGKVQNLDESLSKLKLMGCPTKG
jgi:hypothetical protein